MAYLLQKYKNIIYLTLLLIFVLVAWHIFINKNINVIPEKAKLVWMPFNITENM
ncbi:MAG: hypothetical protein ACOCG5_10405 [Candidatus Alkaliphilus sp. MAG34]